MRRTSELLLAALIGLVATATPVRAGAIFDGFFDGIDDGCRRSAGFEAFENELIARHTPPTDPNVVPSAPADVAASMGAVTVTDEGEWVEVVVPLDGSWRGVALRRLVFTLGKENGIHAWMVEFAAPAETVRAIFGARVAKGNARMAREFSETGASTQLLFDDRVGLVCDYSN